MLWPPPRPGPLRPGSAGVSCAEHAEPFPPTLESVCFMASCIRLFCFVLVSFVMRSAWASDFEAAIADLASEDFARVAAATTRLSETRHPRALGLLEALDEQALYVDQGVVVIRAAAKWRRALDGEPTSVSSPREVAVNNRVRRALAPALAQLRLASPELEVRRAAAAALAKGPEAGALDVMRQALHQESDEAVREALRLGVARLELTSEDAEVRLRAVEVLREVADVSVEGELRRVLMMGPDNTFSEPDERVRQQAHEALRAIEIKTTWINFVANTFYGLSLGSVLLLASLGLAITFGLMRVINMAHGEMLMIGAYATYVTQGVFESVWPALQDWYLVAALPAAFLTCGAVGVVLERLVVRHLYGRPLETLLATWGISLILIQTVRRLFGAQNVTVANPSWLAGGVELMPNLVLPYSRLAIIAFTLLVALLVALLMRRTSFGLQIRAVTQNRAMAASMGVAAQRVDALTFGLGSGVAGLGGVALSQLGNVGPELGQGYIVDSFMVVVLGGVGNLMGSVLGALGLGLLNKYLEPVAGAVMGKILILALIVLFIQKRPQGLFALKGRAAEI